LGVAVGVLLLASSPAQAQGVTGITVSGNEARATVALAGGVGADLTLTFENASGLTAQSVGLSAQLVNPSNLALLSRLPGAGVSIPAAFAVLLAVEPPTLGGLSFQGVVTLELHTHQLGYVAGSPLRLFASSGGGAFVDTTESIGAGSYRARSQRGSFSEFLIVADTRPASVVIESKLDAVDALLDAHAAALGSSLLADLRETIEEARAEEASGDSAAAIEAVEQFAETVEAASGTIPNVWRARRDTTNVAGLLRAAAATLRFSLALENGP
jgi:hypothetical protein